MKPIQKQLSPKDLRIEDLIKSSDGYKARLESTEEGYFKAHARIAALESKLSAAVRERDEISERFDGLSLAFKAVEGASLDLSEMTRQRDVSKSLLEIAEEKLAVAIARNQTLSCIAGAANEKYDTILSVLAGETVTDERMEGNEAAQAVQSLMLKGVRK